MVRKIVGRSILVLVLLAGLGTAFSALAFFLSLPRYAGTATLPGLRQEVTIERDERAIPTIRAASLHDGLMALGYAHAQDRLWQMDLQRRVARGRLAELVGSRGLRFDRFIRTLGLAQAAEASLKSLSDEERAALQAYADGVNAFVHDARILPPEFQLLWTGFEPWHPTDSILILKLMALGLSGNWQDELRVDALQASLSPSQLQDLLDPIQGEPITITDRGRQALSPAPVSWQIARTDGPVSAEKPDGAALAGTRPLAPQTSTCCGAISSKGTRTAIPVKPEAGPSTSPAGERLLDWSGTRGPAPLLAALPDPGAAGLGSNVFVVAGSRTRSGRPILASDPHLDLQSPGIWYLARLVMPDDVLLGGTIPGLPLVVIGRNRNLAWGLTTTYADTQDLFIEQLDGADHYAAPGGSLPFGIEHQVIGNRFGSDEAFVRRTTRHGPVISDVANLPLPQDRVAALAWPALDPDDTTIGAGLELMQAGSVTAARDALRRFIAPVQNVALADRRGATALIAAGRIPVRAHGDGSRPVEGASGSFDWTGYIPFDEAPQTIDPPSGLIVNANNRLVERSYPYLVNKDWPPADRAQRLEAMLEPVSALDPPAAEAIQFDRYSQVVATFRSILTAVQPKDEVERDLLQAMSAWDGVMLPDRPEPLLFAAWYQNWVDRIFAGRLDDVLASPATLGSAVIARVVDNGDRWCDSQSTRAVENCQELAAPALHEVVAQLRRDHGDDWRMWRWGQAHPAVMEHKPLGTFPLIGRLFNLEAAVGGDGSTVNVASFTERPGSLFPTRHMAGLRMVVDLATEEASFLASTGQSGNLLSPHYADMTLPWTDGRYMRLSLDDPRPKVEEKLSLKP